MKKYLLILIAFCLTISLTACGKDDGEESPTGKEQSSEAANGNEEENSSIEDVAEKIELYSDDTKMVFKNGTSQLVYFYSGDEITAYHAYIDYENAATANYALSLIEKDETIAKAYTKGRYLIVEYAKSEYEDLKASEVKALYSYMEQIQKSN